MRMVLVLKGGPGSGHHGHEGRPGKRGGSLPGSGSAPGLSKGPRVTDAYFESGPGSKLFQDMLPEARKMIVGTLVRYGVTEGELQGLKGFTTDAHPDAAIGTQWQIGTVGVYDIKANRIHIKPHTDPAVMEFTVLHELGHHVHYRQVMGRKGKGRVLNALFQDMYNEYDRQKYGLRGEERESWLAQHAQDYGLRSYSFTNAHEFVADTYAVFKLSYKDPAARKQVANINKRVPAAKASVEDVFGMKMPFPDSLQGLFEDDLRD